MRDLRCALADAGVGGRAPGGSLQSFLEDCLALGRLPAALNGQPTKYNRLYKLYVTDDCRDDL